MAPTVISTPQSSSSCLGRHDKCLAISFGYSDPVRARVVAGQSVIEPIIVALIADEDMGGELQPSRPIKGSDDKDSLYAVVRPVETGAADVAEALTSARRGRPVIVTGPFRRVCEIRRERNGLFPAPPMHIR